MEQNKDTYQESWKGEATISEFIKVLQDIQSRYGDLPVHGAYDGNWHIQAEIDVFTFPESEPHIVVGGLS